MLIVSDPSAKQFTVMRSMSSRNVRDDLMKAVSSAYSSSSGKVASAGGRLGNAAEDHVQPLRD